MAKKSKEAWNDYFQNPRGGAIKQFMAQLLQGKYENYDDILTRLVSVILTENDMNAFHKMISSVYEIGYFKAIDEYRDQLKKQGVNVNWQTQENSPKATP